jgi:CBS domain-containing protein
MTIAELIRRDPETVAPDETCSVAARRMRDTRVGSLIVAERRRPLGVVTDRDLVIRVLAAGADPEKVTVGEIMSERPIFLSESTDLLSAVQTMRDLVVRRLPVVDASGAIVGVVSLDDAILVLAAALEAAAQLIRKEM